MLEGLNDGFKYRLKAKGARRIKYLSPYALSLVSYALYPPLQMGEAVGMLLLIENLQFRDVQLTCLFVHPGPGR